MTDVECKLAVVFMLGLALWFYHRLNQLEDKIKKAAQELDALLETLK